MEYAIEFNEVVAEELVRGVSFTVPCGCLGAVVASRQEENDLQVRLMLGLTRPTSGTVTVLGEDVGGACEKQLIPLRKRIAVVFPTGGPQPRHPSQLYEAASEGLILFLLLALLAQQPAIRRRDGLLTGLFLIGYSIARSICELFREPDSYLGFIVGGISMGQILSFPMLLAGLAFTVYALRRPARPAPQS